MNAAVVVCGESVIDLVPQADGDLRALAGGSPVNVSVGLARLGTTVAHLGRFGRDPFGAVMRQHLLDAGVDVSLAHDGDEQTVLAVVGFDAERRAHYNFWAQGAVDWQWTDEELPDPLPAATEVFHTGSMVMEVEPGARVVRALLRRERARGRVTLSYDPNLRLSRARDRDDVRREVEDTVRLCHVVKASDEEVAWLYPELPADRVCARWAGLGPSLVVITRGGEGAYWAQSTGGVQTQLPARCRLVDTVGAGDATTAGLLDGLVRAGLTGGDDPGRVGQAPPATVGGIVARAMVVAALTCERAGADPPTAAEVSARLATDAT